MAIIVLLTSLAFPIISGLKRASDLNSATATIATTLEQARSYAMANNTYVFVGIEETNFSTPLSQSQTAGTGRVAIQLFAALDGTLNLTPSNLTAVSRMQIVDSLDLPASVTATTGTLPNKQPLTSPSGYVVGSSSYPAASSSIVSGNFTFSKIMAFNPQGGLVIPANPAQSSLQYLEVDVQESNGSNVPATNSNQSAIQVDGETGAVIIYRS